VGGVVGEKESERVGAQRELKAHVCDDRLFALLPPGHINLADVYLGYKRDRNYFIGLDSGAVAGYQLSGVVLGHNYKVPELIQVPATSHARFADNVLKHVQTLTVVPPSSEEPNGEHGVVSQEAAILSQLDPRQCKTIMHMAQRGVNYISGTVCPANKDATKGQLESLAKAIEYYWKKTPDARLILQTKWMGSRLQYVYFPGTFERCYSVSRKGFRQAFAPHIDAQIYAQVDKQLSAWCRDQDIDVVILDGELLPWAALGEGLIQEHFQVRGNMCLRACKRLSHFPLSPRKLCYRLLKQPGYLRVTSRKELGRGGANASASDTPRWRISA
jgi:hypothetical protein